MDVIVDQKIKTMIGVLFAVVASASSNAVEYDVVVYGATPAGLTAAFAACEAPINTSSTSTSTTTVGSKIAVKIVETTSDIGGMVTPGGIGLRDIGAQSAEVQGYTREWALLNAEYYNMTSPQWQVSLTSRTWGGSKVIIMPMQCEATTVHFQNLGWGTECHNTVTQ